MLEYDIVKNKNLRKKGSCYIEFKIKKVFILR